MQPIGTAKTRVNTVVKPLDMLLVRDDGYMCMGNIDILGLNPRLRPYYGKATDPPEVVERFLKGQEAQKWAQAIDPATPDITRMTVEQLVDFALSEYGLTLDKGIDYPHALVAVIDARRKSEEEELAAPEAPKVPAKRATAGIAA
jgi:hypothetical protein